ncbi:RidA family protein [Desulforhopalus sp. IMCC35007]|uniref:RidA family protein n=1 Tax=Desulforhopalus sp. IMCC35007 TaxID=2569543 RepID=UPI0010ADEB83|nr:RidA family protein [Desulforhopalus sp. IMCC35007]TKB06780.1 RidA family protein [Desulforhopalus sp. IMCC35007]
MKEIINTTESPAAIGPYSQAVKHGNMLFTSGQIPLDPVSGEVVDGDITVQTTRVMDNLVAVLKAGGASVDSVVKTTCFLDNMADFAAFNAVYAKYFTDKAPARSCVAVDKLPKGVLVEVEAIAIAQ